MFRGMKLKALESLVGIGIVLRLMVSIHKEHS